MSGTPAATFDPLWERVTKTLDEASGLEGEWARAAAVGNTIEAIDDEPGMEQKSIRNPVIAKLRRRILAEVNALQVEEPTVRARLVTAIQLFASVGFEGRVREADLAGLKHRMEGLKGAMTLTPFERRIAREHVVTLNFGELGTPARSPVLLETFLDWVLAERPGPTDRARTLHHAMLKHRVVSAEEFLWFHLRQNRADAAELFEKNDPSAIEKALGELLANDVAWEAMCADDDYRHAGWRRLVIGRNDTLGTSHLMRIVANKGCDRWVDIGNPYETGDLQRLLRLPQMRPIVFDRARPDFTRVLPLAVRRRELRLVEASEVPQPEMDFIEGNPYEAEDIARIPAIEGSTLYTVGGLFLTELPIEDERLFRGAVEAKVTRNPIGKMRILENLLPLLKPGDLLSFTDCLAPVAGSACYLTLGVRPDGRGVVRGSGFAARGQPIHYDLR